MSLAITGSSLVLQDDVGASEVVLDLNFSQMTSQTLSAGVNTLSDGTACWVTLADSPPQCAIVNGQGLSVRCVTNDVARIYFNVTGAVNAGKPVASPGLYNARDRIRIIAEISGTTFTGAGANGDTVFAGIYNGFFSEAGSGVFAGTNAAANYSLAALHVDSGNGNKFTPRIWYAREGLAAAADYTGVDERAVTPENTWIILESDNMQGSGWLRYKTGSSPMAPFSTGLPKPEDLTTFGRTRMVASSATAIAADTSPFTGSVMANVTFWAPVTEVSASITRLAIIRYGYIK